MQAGQIVTIVDKTSDDCEYLPEFPNHRVDMQG